MSPGMTADERRLHGHGTILPYVLMKYQPKRPPAFLIMQLSHSIYLQSLCAVSTTGSVIGWLMKCCIRLVAPGQAWRGRLAKPRGTADCTRELNDATPKTLKLLTLIRTHLAAT